MNFGLSKFGLSRFGMARWLYESSKTGAEGGAGSEKTDDGTGSEKSEDAGKEKGPEKKDAPTFSEEQQKIVDRLVGDARTKEREKAKAEAQTEAEKEKKKNEQQALKDQQKWQELAETREQEIQTLTKERDEALTFKEQADKYKAALDTQLVGIKKTLPKHLLPLLEKMDPVEALEYLTTNAKELNFKAATYPETPEDKEKTLSKDEQEAGKNSVARTIHSAF